MTPRHPWLLSRERALLCVIDLQDPFLKVIWERERLISAARLLVEAAKTLDIPLLTTVQYREKLGGVTSQIAEILPPSASDPIDKLTFSCAANPDFRSLLSASGRDQILLCGLETHICVQQTALDLIHQGYQVHCAADAVSARSVERHKLGMEKMRDAGVIPCAAESAVFELLREAGTPEFKALQQLVK
ncbi:MAG TPA: isochorismatase family protein [Capsulimonadaceae bacterium]|nr:isochorismatase family protein [Capsulimonadaceae bacterium]